MAATRPTGEGGRQICSSPQQRETNRRRLSSQSLEDLLRQLAAIAMKEHEGTKSADDEDCCWRSASSPASNSSTTTDQCFSSSSSSAYFSCYPHYCGDWNKASKGQLRKTFNNINRLTQLSRRAEQNCQQRKVAKTVAPAPADSDGSLLWSQQRNSRSRLHKANIHRDAGIRSVGQNNFARRPHQLNGVETTFSAIDEEQQQPTAHWQHNRPSTSAYEQPEQNGVVAPLASLEDTDSADYGAMTRGTYLLSSQQQNGELRNGKNEIQLSNGCLAERRQLPLPLGQNRSNLRYKSLQANNAAKQHTLVNGFVVDGTQRWPATIQAKGQLAPHQRSQSASRQTSAVSTTTLTNGYQPVTTVTINGGGGSPPLCQRTANLLHQRPSTSSSQNGHSSASPPPAAHVAVNGSRRSSGSNVNNNNNCSSPKRLSPIMNGGQSDDSVAVAIRMKADAHGRFGFNVKGGADQNYPIIVSRVVPASPADTCYPRLNEGDQVLAINGRDVTQLDHDSAVRYIRAARDTHNGELLLTVRPNVYVSEDLDEEPAVHYVPDTPRVDERQVAKSDRLDQSLLLLKDALSSGTALMQFEQLYRKKAGMALNCSKMSENASKNRYRDVSPYDATRVVIQDGLGGDYINANFVNVCHLWSRFVQMEIPASGIVNRYIAAQGPLPNTTADFWQMIWEQLCPTVVMLTTTTERGRVKCHHYWPRLRETVTYGRLAVCCAKESETSSTSRREFRVVNTQTKEERQVSQMQYLAWPDHGVPDDASEFIDFVAEVRGRRSGSLEPMLVHCSAGIGRTGVLILFETAMCLIEANEPVYPLDIVQTMRQQRPMLIQTTSQYKFVCEAVLRAYEEGGVKPSAEYQQNLG